MRIRELAGVHVCWGYPRIWIKLRREGWRVNRKRIYRLYKQEGLAMRPRKPRRHRSASPRIPPPTAGYANESWSMDFMADELFDGRRFRVLTIVDDFTRESLAVEVEQHLTGGHVAEVLDRIVVRGRGRSASASTTERSSPASGWITGRICRASSWNSAGAENPRIMG